MRRYAFVMLGCVVVAVVTAGCSFHVFGRYDCRTGTVRQRQGGELVDELFKEAARGLTEKDSDGTSKN